MAKFASKPTSGRGRKVARGEASRIKAIIDFEVSENKASPTWTFKDGGGLSRVVEDFYLVTEYLESQESERLRHWCRSLHRAALEKDQLDEINKITDEEKKDEALFKAVQPLIRPLWSFFVALCHALQEDENELTAYDAFWLGLVDEVMGDNDLITMRWFEEWQPDPTPEKTPEKVELEAGKLEDETGVSSDKA